MLNRHVCRKLGEAVGCWVRSEAGPGRDWASDEEVLADAARSAFHQLLVNQLARQEGEYFWEDSLVYREYARGVLTAVHPPGRDGSGSAPGLRLLVAYPVSYGDLDDELEGIVGRACAGGGSTGETRDLDWWFEGCEAEQAEQVLFRLRADERFTARLIEISEE